MSLIAFHYTQEINNYYTSMKSYVNYDRYHHYCKLDLIIVPSEARDTTFVLYLSECVFAVHVEMICVYFYTEKNERSVISV